jgi:hypothetical protein
MAEDPRPHLSGKWLRLLIAAAALAVIAVVAYIGSVLLFDPGMSNVSLFGLNFGGGPDGGVEAVPTEPVAAPTPQVVATFTPAPQYTPTDSPTPMPTDTPTPAYPEAVVSAETLNLRTGPGTVYGTVGQVLAGQRFRITGRNGVGDWLQICCPAGANRESWISADFAQSNLPISSLPVVQAPPTPTPSATIDAPDLDEVDLSLPAPGGFDTPRSTNPLTGQPLEAARWGLRPVIVCINNDIAARPQFGISQADVMYEFLMEGFSLTRFSAVFYGADSEEIGPVRSARLINYYMGALYDAGLFCSGASNSIRYKLKNENSLFPYLDVDLDDPENYRYSTSVGNDYRTRLRTSSDLLRGWLAEWGVERAPLLQGFAFDGPAGGGASANSISIPYPSVTASQVTYRYDAGSGRYWRFLGGAAHGDGNSGQQIAVENVIVQYVFHEPVNIVEDSIGSLSLHISLFGTGRAIVFRDGLAYEGFWRNDSSGEMPRFFTADGAEIPLKAGQSWISIVPLTYEIAYQ